MLKEWRSKRQGPTAEPVTPQAGRPQPQHSETNLTDAGNQQPQQQQLVAYPNSPTTLPNVAFDPTAVAAGDLSGFAVQYSKPHEASSVKLLAFPKPGTSFERWWDHALDSISASTSLCTEAYRWVLACEQSEATFESFAVSGGFVRLDALLLASLLECIPGDTHLLRQDIKKG